ncbi:MAG: type II toxin-antitoxin system HicB family antitoxin [Ignavibacteria bacterium]
MDYIIVIEKSKNGYGAYAPDLPGVGVVADTKDEVIKSIKKAILMHIEDLEQTGQKIPKPKTEVFKLHVA